MTTPCKRGHNVGRNADGGCKECTRLRSAAWARNNAERHARRVQNWRSRNPERTLELARAQYYKDPRVCRAWQEGNRNKVRKAQAEHAKRYPEKFAAKSALRRATILQRTPKWADLGEIAAIYELAKRMTERDGVQYHVDHEVPLKGHLASGLHVAGNLRIVTATENHIKANRFHVLDVRPNGESSALTCV